jgi:hypothetical protein
LNKTLKYLSSFSLGATDDATDECEGYLMSKKIIFKEFSKCTKSSIKKTILGTKYLKSQKKNFE